MDFSPGINIFIGANGTGKTHILKVLYAACDITKTKLGFADKINRVFLPSQRKIGRLVNRKVGSGKASIEVYRGDNLKIGCDFSVYKELPTNDLDKWAENWRSYEIDSAYIPVKEMLANAPGFLSLYAERLIHFEEVYNDIINRANRPIARGRPSPIRSKYINSLQKIIDGRVIPRNFEYFLKTKAGKEKAELEFTLLAEGMRKLALLLLLIKNDTLVDGSILFWDEPEANLNPSMKKVVIDLLLKLQRDGVQIFIATHDYIVLKEFDLLRQTKDKIRFFALYHDKENKIQYNSTDDFLMIEPNLIQETFLDIYDRDIERALKSIAGGDKE
ncbi:AAA family ATPase [bacterium]|nr:AAA family ATPase [FCB group bacterium]MBL7191450.1 AAA family ATPase [bacterium]